ncbi:MAG: 30S ribosomal protein S16 [Parachlamydiales bacterium]|jgi:small subunit ribosomal protein S16
MALKIRLRQQGRSNSHTYRIVVIDARQARDGKYVEALGWYCPLASVHEENFALKADRIQHWLNMGAEISENVVALLARGAPEVLRTQREKAEKLKVRQAAKRRERRRAKQTA